MRSLLRSLALLLLAATPLGAQTRETINVTVVEVPVTVVDGKGNPVRGLTRANFEVVDDGQKRPITFFDKIDFASPESMAAASRLNPAARRNFLLLFDLTYSTPRSVLRAQDAARDFIARGMQPRDIAAVATIDVERGVRFLTAFTTDRRMLTAAIADPRTFRARDPLYLAGTDLEATPSSGGGRATAPDPELREMTKQIEQMGDAYERSRIERQFDLLAEMAATLKNINGRKQVILLSEGFDPRLVRGRELGTRDKDNAEEDLAVARGQMWNIDSDGRFGSSTALRRLDEMSEAFQRAGVTLNTIDIKGVRVQNDTRSGAQINSNDALFLLSRPTGGDVFRDSNDLTAEFDRLLRRQEVVYVVGFQAPAREEGRYHPLKVRLVGGAAGRVTHRAGYYELGPQSAVERSLTTAEVIINDIPQSELTLAALVTPFPAESARADVPVILEVPGTDLVKAARDGKASVEVFVYAFDSAGLVRDSLYQRVALDMAKADETLRTGGIKYYGTLRLSGGERYAVKSLVRVGESDSKGYVRTDVFVPNAADVAVSPPLFFEDPGRWVMVRGEARGPASSYPFHVGGEPFIPSAAVRVHPGEQRRFALFVYNADPTESTLETTPPARLVSESRRDHVTKLVFELGHVEGAKELEIALRKRGSADIRTTKVPLE